MELSLQESMLNKPSNAGFNQPSVSSRDQNTSSKLFSSVHGNRQSKRQSQENASVSAPTGSKACNPSSLGLFRKGQPKQGTLTKYSAIPSMTGSIEEDEEEEPMELTDEQLAALENIPGFDKGAGQVWIYPTNFPVRDYQFSIVKAALFTNTLVVLPTGLGKTFIAAVLMYNFYRWYPQGKIVFMAPTKPLVAQQIEACYNIMGIPQTDAAEMTGAMQPAERKQAWQSRRVFFLTPQVLTNDLSREACPALRVKCLVIDEAHKALGNHAYCQVVRELAKYEGEFRVLALSATPGSDMKAVQQVITNLMISHVELRGEDSPDIKPYTHERRVEKVVVQLGQELTNVKERYLRVMNMVINRLKRAGVVYNKEVTSLSKFLMLKSRDAFRQNPPHNLPNQQFGAIEGDFALAISLYHGYDLLLLHGLRSLQSYLLSLISGEKGYGRTRAELLRNADFTEMMEMIKKFTPVKNALPSTQQTQSASQLAAPFEVGHPKMAKLQEIALDHFTNFDGPDDPGGTVSTRIMIFAQYRDSVSEITEMLNRHRPLIKCMSFIGQSSVSKGTKGFTQKEQLMVMKRFREGGYNTLVSTCVGEEGLDIGDVDLIICFDAHKSPIRLVQRMGRTGRKREGRIIMLVTAGKEEQIYNQSQYTKRSIHKAIQNGARSLIFYPNRNRMVPEGLNPRCHRMHITVKESFLPKTKAAKGAKSTSRNTATKSTGRKQPEDGFLKPEELQYWNENFKVAKEEIPILPPSNFVSLKGAPENHDTSSAPQISLSEWMPWQNRPQSVIFVDHSKNTHTLVDMVEFMQIQASIGNDEDTYGQEMQAYLNKEDIHIKTNKAKGIFRYCTPSADMTKSDLGNTVAKGLDAAVSKISRPRRSDLLPTFSSDEDVLLISSDEEELPIFDGAKTNVDRPPISDKSKGKGKGKGKKSCVKAIDPVDSLAKNLSDEELPMCYKLEDIPVKNDDTSSSKSKSKTTKRKSKTKKQHHEDIVSDVQQKKNQKFKSCDKQFSTVGTEGKAKQKKKRSSTEKVNMSFVALIEDLADEDFEGSSTTDVPLPKLPVTIPKLSKQDELPDCNIDLLKDNETRPDRAVSENSDVAMISDNECETMAPAPSSVTTSTADHVLSQAFPIFTPHKAFMITNDVKKTVAPLPSGYDFENGMCRVMSPPPVEDLQQALSEIEDRGCVSPVDILSLVDKWEKEKLPSSPHRPQTTTTANEICKTRKISEAITPIRVHSVFDKPGQMFSQLTKLPSGETKAVKNQSDEDLTDDLFFGGSMVVEEPYLRYKDDKVKSPKERSPVRVCDLPISPETSEVVDHDLEQISDISNASSTAEKILPPVTPLVTSTIGRTAYKSNTSTPVGDNTETKLNPFIVDKSFMNGDILLSDHSSKKPRSIKRKSDPSFDLYSLNKQSTPFQQTKKTGSPTHDSFFSDLHDDSVLGAIETPSIVNKTPVTKATPSTSTRAITSVMDTPKDCIKAPFPVLSKSKTPPSVLETSQLTFTQAFACVNESFSTSCDSTSPFSTKPKEDKSVSDNENQPAPNNASNNRCGKPIAEGVGNVQSTSYVNDGGNSQSCTPKKEAVKDPAHDTDPQFDLGFDFDDFDDEMVVPPSPQATKSSQSFSQRFKAESFISQPADTSSLLQNKTSICHDTAVNKENVSTSTFVSKTPSLDKQQATSPPKSRQTVDSGPFIFGDLKQDNTVGALANFSDSLAEIFADGDSEELFCDEEDWEPDPVSEKENAPVNNPCTVPIVNPVNQLSSAVPSAKANFKTPVKPAPKTTKSSKLIPEVNMSDDSPIMPPRKRQWAARIEDEAEDNSPLAQQSKRRRPLAVVISDDDSPIATVKARRRVPPARNYNALEEEEDDFITKNADSKRRENVHKKRSLVPKTRQLAEAAEFLEVEAERSEDDCSEDEADDSNEEYDLSFINDCTQMSQADPVDPADMRAVYLQSVRSPVRSGSRFRLVQDFKEMDVFSQVPQQDDDYMEDSFVVSGKEDDSDAYDDDRGEEEVTLLDMGMDMTMSRQTRRQARIAVNRRAAQQAVPPKGRRPKATRRVVRTLDSSSDEEVERTKIHSPKTSKSKKNKILSTSSSSNTPSPVKHLGSKDEYGGIQEKQQGQSNTAYSQQSGITQLTGLEKRCMQRLQGNITSVNNDKSADNGRNISCNKKLASEKSSTKETYSSKSKAASEYDDPTFCLGVDFLDDNWDDDFSVSGVASKSKTVDNTNINQTRFEGISKEVSKRQCDTNFAQKNPKEDNDLSEKERRLKLSRQRQEEFRKKLSDKSAMVKPQVRERSSHGGSQIHELSQSPALGDVRSDEMPLTPNLSQTNVRSQTTTSLVTPVRNAPKGQLVIFVDSKEINGARDLISILRFKHNAQTVIRQLSTCDFIISNRMAIDRMSLSTFTNSSRRPKLFERVRTMCEVYDRPCLIIERDALKPDEKPSRPQPNTKYTDSIMAALAQTHVKLLFSDSQEQTAGLMAELATQEQKKGQGITVPTELSNSQEQMMRFYFSLPRVSYVTALYLLHSYKRPVEMVHCTHARLMERGRMSAIRATDLRTYLSRNFDLQMLGVRS